MFKKFKKYNHIIVFGSHRSGTRIAAKIIANDLKYRYVDEHEISSIRNFQKILLAEYKCVIQAPTYTSYARILTGKKILIVFMKRDINDIICSQKRIGWGVENSKHTLKHGNREEETRSRYFGIKGLLVKIIYETWEKYQKPYIKNYYELEYESLSKHSLWIDKKLRKNFAPYQTTLKDFNRLFNGSKLPKIAKIAKTLSKKECEAVYDYMKEVKPKTLLEFGTQYGISTRMFWEISDWLGLKLNIHSWDIKDKVRYMTKNLFTFHKEDILGREKIIFNKYKPNLIFLDMHTYELTKNIMEICLERKIDFMCHDISFKIGIDMARKRSKNFTIKEGINTPWELYMLGELISKELFKEDFYENDKLSVNCTRDKYGLAIVRHK